jgi:hypothetical protein
MLNRSTRRDLSLEKKELGRQQKCVNLMQRDELIPSVVGLCATVATVPADHLSTQPLLVLWETQSFFCHRLQTSLRLIHVEKGNTKESGVQ